MYISTRIEKAKTRFKTIRKQGTLFYFIAFSIMVAPMILWVYFTETTESNLPFFNPRIVIFIFLCFVLSLPFLVGVSYNFRQNKENMSTNNLLYGYTSGEFFIGLKAIIITRILLPIPFLYIFINNFSYLPYGKVYEPIYVVIFMVVLFIIYLIVHVRFTMVIPILTDPNSIYNSAFDILKVSKQIMKDYKIDYVKAILSSIWLLLLLCIAAFIAFGVLFEYIVLRIFLFFVFLGLFSYMHAYIQQIRLAFYTYITGYREIYKYEEDGALDKIYDELSNQ